MEKRRRELKYYSFIKDIPKKDIDEYNKAIGMFMGGGIFIERYITEQNHFNSKNRDYLPRLGRRWVKIDEEGRKTFGLPLGFNSKSIDLHKEYDRSYTELFLKWSGFSYRWGMLMKAVAFIEKKGYDVVITHDRVEIKKRYDKKDAIISIKYSQINWDRMKFDGVYIAVLRFIEWLTQKKIINNEEKI